MQEQIVQDVCQREIEYQNYFSYRNTLANQKIVLSYKDSNLEFTQKQIEILKLIAKGFSNAKIANHLLKKEATVKLLVYRLMKYLENVLNEKVDRFYLVIIAQELILKQEL